MEGKSIYNIWHCKRLPNVTKPIPSKVDREYAGSVWATSLEEAFRLSQGDINPNWAKLGCRSTSVGDVISGPDSKMYMVTGTGFEVFE